MTEVNGENKRQFYQRHIEAWKKSKMTRTKYCKESGLSYRNFRYWLEKLQETGKRKPLSVIKLSDHFDLHSLYRIPPSPGRGLITLWIGEYRIEVCPGFCTETLSQLVCTLKVL
jgi:uncharacterized Fe-S cluster-containing radical SAM superfamily enzyme